MTAVWIILRIALFLGIGVPVFVWLVRAVRLQQELPADRASSTAHYQNQARVLGWGGDGGGGGGCDGGGG